MNMRNKTLAEQFEAAFLGQVGGHYVELPENAVIHFKDGSIYDHQDCTTYTKEEWKKYGQAVRG